ncbi:MAG: DUF4115 domain-containing protein [Woeseiaceae bacterium]|nr:DUF4115 domain-containing protein [Woeseiaceae bacterium]
MSDDAETPDIEEAAPPESEGPRAGERLAAARREQQIALDEVAKELHLDEPKVRALESNDFDVLGAPVFAKGHLRKYAQLVGVSIDDVMAEYYALNRAPGMPPVVGKVRKQQRKLSPGPWIAVVVIIIVAAAAYWWFVARGPVAALTEPVSPPPPEEAATIIEEADTTVIDEAPLAEPDDGVEEPDVTMGEPAMIEDTGPADAAPAPVAEAVTTPTANVTAAEGETLLTLTFSGDCWTEISDAAGQRLFFDLGREGRTVNLAGEAPFSVIFGDADAVVIDVDGQPYAISPADRRGQMARLTIFAP